MSYPRPLVLATRTVGDSGDPMGILIARPRRGAGIRGFTGSRKGGAAMRRVRSKFTIIVRWGRVMGDPTPFARYRFNGKDVLMVGGIFCLSNFNCGGEIRGGRDIEVATYVFRRGVYVCFLVSRVHYFRTKQECFI